MADITAALVKDLRERTGAGMMDCKKALTETEGEIDAAVDWLRKQGLAAAAKKSGRTAAEGLVAVATGDGGGAIVEVNSETDFVARNEKFQAFAAQAAELAMNAGEIDALIAAAYPGGATVGDELTKLVGAIGENLVLRRTAALSVAPGVVASYIHNAVAPGLGRIGVLVALKSEGDATALAEFGKQLAMHVAAAAPMALAEDELDPGVVAREREIFAEQARASGKPDEIVVKMVEGRLRKFYEEVVLGHQTFVIDGETKVGKAIKAKAEEIGAPIEITGFLRVALGEGIEKEETDFAAEVAAQLKG